MNANDPIAVRLVDPAAARDGRLVDEVADLINRVYVAAESGLWGEGAQRTTAPEVADLIASEQIVVAEHDGQIAGAVRLHDVADDASEFGMLAAAPEQRGLGIGRALLDFAEGHSRDRGLRAIQLELLLPRTWQHPSKEFLKAWYGRRGYRLVRTTTVEASHPHLSPLLATPCDLEVHEKRLR